MSLRLSAAAVAMLLACGDVAAAADAFYQVPLGKLNLTEGELPDGDGGADWRRLRLQDAMQPYVRLDAVGEAYVGISPQAIDELNGIGVLTSPSEWKEDAFVVVRSQPDQEVAGGLFLPKADLSGMVAVRFTIPASVASPEAEQAFYRAKAAHYSRLARRNVAGAAWFRHQARQARSRVPEKRDEDHDIVPVPGAVREGDQASELEDTYALFSGGRALSENLQLDRVLAVTRDEQATIEVDSLVGITINEIDWEPLIKGLQPAADPLAHRIPADQHAVFFSSFDAAVAVADELERQGVPVQRLVDERAENALTRERYERQLGVSLSGLVRQIGPHVVRSVALTGSDPYFRTGTDVAVLMESPRPPALQALLMAQVSAAASPIPGTQKEQGEVEGLSYAGFRSPDRTVSSYTAVLEGAVVVTNSLAQLARLAKVHGGQTPALASLSEYKFFRHRYPHGDEAESAFMFLSDATIRRWCSPRWRIATSRRTRAAGIMADVQAAHLDGLAAGTVEAGPVHTDFALASAGQLRLSAGGVYSSVHNTLGFMTPIVELDVNRVTQAEAEAYRRWREGYQSNWQWAFDPIGLRLGLGEKKLAADLTVMPLIWGSEYRESVELARGAQIGPNSGDPHDSLAHWVLAINANSQTMRGLGASVSTFLPGVRAEPFSWLGSSIAAYADDDPFWNELRQAGELPELPSRFIERNLNRIPVGFYCEVASPIKLTAFLTALRGFMEQTAPGMTNWEPATYQDEPYVKVTPTERAKGDLNGLDPTLFYTLSADGLLLTCNQGVLERYIDRVLARREAKAAGGVPEDLMAGVKPWLGSSHCLQVDRKLLSACSIAIAADYQAAMQMRAWGNLPVLNEWKLRYPDRDPIELHEQLWQTRLVCPGGGHYVWNDQWQTMESTVYGHPGEPQSGPPAPPILASFLDANFGLTFEDQGLRARAEVTREKP